MPLGFDLLQLEVFRHALTGPFSAQFRPYATRDGHHARVDLRMRRRVTLQFIRHAQLQSAPLTRHFAQIIALLPALQTVRGSVPFILFFERGGLLDRQQRAVFSRRRPVEPECDHPTARVGATRRYSFPDRDLWPCAMLAGWPRAAPPSTKQGPTVVHRYRARNPSFNPQRPSMFKRCSAYYRRPNVHDLRTSARPVISYSRYGPWSPGDCA